jgi:hypothetical protein
MLSVIKASLPPSKRLSTGRTADAILIAAEEERRWQLRQGAKKLVIFSGLMDP